MARIDVSRQGSGDTRILVSEWPDTNAPWRVSSSDHRGRELEISGYSNFSNRVVGHLTLHLDGRKPLLITSYRFEDHLVEADRPEVLYELVLCAREIAKHLHNVLDVGTGALMWQVESKSLPELSRRFKRFETVPRRKRLRPGKRYLIWPA
jgi:hypothetical protein